METSIKDNGRTIIVKDRVSSIDPLENFIILKNIKNYKLKKNKCKILFQIINKFY